jgi:hypothetical protein
VEKARALIAIVGKGENPGMAARVSWYPGHGPPEIPPEPSARMLVGRERTDAETKLGRTWALVSGHYPPLPTRDGFTVKISRHVDETGTDWVWVGLYESVKFADDNRDGFYFGSGIAFENVPQASIICTTVNRLFAQARQELFRGDQMARTVFDLELERLDLPPMGPQAPLDTTRGLNPRSDVGTFVPTPVLAADVIEDQIKLAIEGSHYRPYSTLYLTTGRGIDSGSEFYVPVDAPPLLSTASQPSASQVQVPEEYSAEEVSYLDLDSPQDRELASALSPPSFDQLRPYDQKDPIWSKLIEIDRTVKNIERQMLNSIDAKLTEDRKAARDDWETYDGRDWASRINTFAKFVAVAVIVVLISLIIYTVGSAVYEASLRSVDGQFDSLG